METRKIQKVGTSTLTLSLPREWLERCGLRKGDPVLLVEDGERLHLSPAGRGDPGSRRGDHRIVDADRCPAPGMLERVLVGHYVLGRRRVTVRSAGPLPPAHREAIYRTVRRLIAFGIVEEGPSLVVLQCSLDPANFPLSRLLRRLHGLVAGMAADAVEALLRADRGRAEEVLRREEDADTTYWLILRLALSALLDETLLAPLGLRSRLEISGYRVAARDLESAGDSAEDAARAALLLLDRGTRLREGLGSDFSALASAAAEALSLSVEGLLGGDLLVAEGALRLRDEVRERAGMLVRSLHRDHGSPAEIGPLTSVVESLQEIAVRAGSMAVIAFNRHLEGPSPWSGTEPDASPS